MAKLSLQDGELARANITLAQERKIAKLYRDVYDSAKAQLEAMPKNDSTSSSLKRLYLKQITKQLDAAYREVRSKVESEVKSNLEKTSEAVVKDVNAFSESAGLKVKGAYSYVPKDIVQSLTTGQLYGGDWTLSKALWGQERKTTGDIQTIVAQGIAANKSAYDIAKDLEQYVNPSAKKEWDWSKVYPGTNKKIDYNAQRLARTMVSHAYQQSLLTTTKHNPFVKGYRWRAAHTNRTCEICADRDGQIFTADDLPLDHPNGMCTFICEIPESMDQIADRLADWAGGSSDDGIENWYNSMLRGE